MKKLTLLLLISILLTSCQQLFVWTFKDVVVLSLFGITILYVIGYVIYWHINNFIKKHLKKRKQWKK